MAQQSATLREQLEANYDKIVAPPETQETRVETVVAETRTPEAPTGGTAETEKAETRTAEERARDEAGRFTKPEAKPEAKPASKVAATEAKPSQVAQIEKLGVKRPDSWKKELWPIWDKLDAGESLTREERKQFMEYLPEREGQYLKGVSAYKAEWDRAKPLLDALTPYQQMMQASNLKPEQFITALANTHQTLSSGTAQDKLRAFARFAQDYQIPVHELFIQGEDGKLYFNQAHLQEQQAKPVSVEEVKRQVLQEMQKGAWVKAIQDFATAANADGSKTYPHFEEVRKTMDGLLRSGLSKDLKGAYETALRLPEHLALYEASQKASTAAADAAKVKEDAERAARARAQVTQTKTSTPTGSTEAKGTKGLRASLESAYDTHVAGRI